MTARAGAALSLLMVAGACTVAGPRPGAREAPAPRLEGGEPSVRVGIQVDVPSVRVAGTSRVELVDEAGRVRAGGTGPWTVVRSGDGLEARGPGEAVRVPGPLVVRPVGGRVRVDDTLYRGAALVRPAEEGVTAVNLLDLETYLLGVVPMEIGGGRPPEELEAVKAQAIAARTYAVRQLGRREELGFDYYGSVLDQAYGGADAEDSITSRAVEETRGQVIVYEGEPIEAYYHSTCGGRTAPMEEVWGGEGRPYLRSVSDRRPDGGWYCESSSRFRWTEEWSHDALLRALTAGLRERGATGEVTSVESLEVTGRTQSGRAEAVEIVTNLGTHVVRGDTIRWVLRPEPDRILNSSAIELDPFGDGEVRSLVVEGAGWGHGIGMCQVGALGRSRAGQSYRDILLTYYPGTRIVRLY